MDSERWREGLSLESFLDGMTTNQELTRRRLQRVVLAEAEEPLPLGQIAERLACVKSNITQLVDRLEGDGLVQRVTDSEDRRSKRAAITAEGLRRYELGLKAKLEVERELLGSLSPQESEQVTLALGKLSAAKTR